MDDLVRGRRLGAGERSRGAHWTVFGEQLAAYASVAPELHGELVPLMLEDCELPNYRTDELSRTDFPGERPLQRLADALEG